jgi:hypothetical protein
MLGRVQPKAMEGFSFNQWWGLGWCDCVPSGRKIMVLALELFDGLDT